MSQNQIHSSKPLLRTHFKLLRSSLTPAEVITKSNQITSNFIHNLLPQIPNWHNKTFAVYLSHTNEVKTNTLIDFFKKNQIRYCFAKITAPDSPLSFTLAKPDQKFSPNKFYPKVIEPVEGQNTEPDIIITPLLAFDSKLNRLGMGGGFFDRTISSIRKQNPNVKIIGFAYDFQRSTTPLPISILDQMLDFVATESSIFRIL